ncbi:MAG: hypothetical protein ACI8QN_001093 [Porticoccaceae bacterium]|jgi:hypothetical protein|tara:strand:- start:176 stop:1939 length:1764 start_codon:yes stop_codon:yes gene_type:complete
MGCTVQDNSLTSSMQMNAKTQVLPMRPDSQVMQLERLGSFHQSRLSFMRTLVRRMVTENWQITSPVFDLDDQGYGTVVYQVEARFGTFSYVLFSHYLDPDSRNDRVIANQWDLTMALCEGKVDADQLAFLRTNVPKQEAGRVDSRVLVLSRANRSGRTFEYVVSELAEGRQPCIDVIAEVGYLYRTTAAYGSGKLGMADWEKVRTKHPDFARPFAAEMFTCFMLRHFSMQQADHLASRRAPGKAVILDKDIKRYLGIGNSTGLGMAPFLINHPLLISQWIEMRETALARVILASESGVDEPIFFRLAASVQRVIQHLGEIVTADERQHNSNILVRKELQVLLAWMHDDGLRLLRDHYVWANLVQYVEQFCHIETQELINTLLIELYPELVDDLEEQMGIDESIRITPEMPVTELLQIIEDKYDWALIIDFTQYESIGAFWYRSQEKMEPRLGQTNIDMGMEKEMPMAIGRRVRKCYDQASAYNLTYPQQNVAHFIMRHPNRSGIVGRIQTLAQRLYGDIRENLVHSNVLPIHLLRCKLSFFGVSKFDPRSRLWVRNTMFQGAPLISDFGKPFVDDWQFPIKPVLTSG